MEEGCAVNNNQDVLFSLLNRSDRHHCRPGERPVCPPSGPQQRSLFCKTHAVGTKCAHDCSPHGNDVAPLRPKPLRLNDFSRQQVLVLLTLALGNFLSFCSMSILAPFFPKEVTHQFDVMLMKYNIRAVFVELNPQHPHDLPLQPFNVYVYLSKAKRVNCGLFNECWPFNSPATYREVDHLLYCLSKY